MSVLKFGLIAALGAVLLNDCAVAKPNPSSIEPAFVAEQLQRNSKRINIFPNPNVPYQIPLHKSPKKQAKYLFGILKKDIYSKLERQLRRYVPELRKIDKDDIEPLDDIVGLAVTATNPEVREAFDLIVTGGIGNKLVRYGSRWNSQLRLLYWLAFENEFEPNDILALAVAISNGIWEAMGDDQVDQRVKNDSNGFLKFQRTNNPHVKNYPLEGLLALAWRGNYSATGEPYTHPLYRDHIIRPVDISVYDWNTLSMETLEDMRSYAQYRGWKRSDIGKIEDFFYFDACPATVCSSRWNFVLGSPLKNNVDAVWQQYEWQNRIEGDCAIESIIIDGLGKAIGVPTTILLRQAANKNGMVNSHMYILYFDSDRNIWTPYSKQLNVDMGLTHSYVVAIYRPPVRLNRYLYHRWTRDGRIGKSNMWYTVGTDLTLEEVRRTFTNGVSSSEMKTWLTEY